MTPFFGRRFEPNKIVIPSTARVLYSEYPLLSMLKQERLA